MKQTQAKARKDETDKFALYIAVFVLILFVVIAAVVYQVRSSQANPSNLTYIELKQTIVNDQGLVARLSVSVQVNVGDEDWLKENEKALNAQFKKEISAMDVETLRTKDGFVELQDELMRRFNFVFETDKIQAVMVTELLLQDQRN